MRPLWFSDSLSDEKLRRADTGGGAGLNADLLWLPDHRPCGWPDPGLIFLSSLFNRDLSEIHNYESVSKQNKTPS